SVITQRSVSSCGKLTIDSPFKNGGLVQMLNLEGMVGEITSKNWL
ncbi:MAG: hypothetical protein ACI85F_001851, partial [Bacteroidia bacterium]